MRTRIHSLWNKLKTSLHKLNFFRSELSVNEYQTQTKIISTCVSFVAFAILLTVLIIYTPQISILKVITIQSPSYTTYIELYQKYPKTLSCSCKNIAIRYDQFMSVEARFHQVCQSDFVSDAYFLYLSRSLSTDFTVTVQAHFQLMASWCRFANWSVTNGRATFGVTQFTTNEVLHIDLFDKQIQSLIHLFTTSMTNTFVRTLTSIRQITHSNALLNAFGTNTYPKVAVVFSDLYYYMTDTFSFENSCSCVLYPNCSMPVSFTIGPTFYTIPGLRLGCYMTEALLQSTLECYYNQSCVDTLHSIIQSTLSFNGTALDSTVDSQFNTSSLISSLVAEMMIENWTYTWSHEVFYNNCQPSACVFSYEDKNGFFDVVIIFMELIGGLTMILKILIPRIVKRLRRRYTAQEPQHSRGNLFLVFRKPIFSTLILFSGKSSRRISKQLDL